MKKPRFEITIGAIPGPVKAVLYGIEGIGKSTFASRWPGAVFIDTEGSTRRLEVARLPAPASWETLLEEVEFVASDGLPSCRTLVIDTADWAERLCISAICARFKVKGIEDFGYGKGYTYAREEFQKLLDGLDKVILSGRNVLVTAHAQITSFDLPEGAGSYSRWAMKTSKQVAPLLREWCDLLLFANYKTVIEKSGSGPSAPKNSKYKASGKQRVMYTTHDACWDAKNRFDLPDECPFDFAVLAPFVPGTDAAPALPFRQTKPQERPAPSGPEADILPTPAPEPASPALKQQDAARAALAQSLSAEGVPPALAERMIAAGVSSEMLRHAVHQRGCYPEDTPIAAYDPQFVQESLVASWDKWHEYILDNADIPF